MSIQKEDARDYLIRYNPRTGLAHVITCVPAHRISCLPRAQLTLSLPHERLSYISQVRLSLSIGWVFSPNLLFDKGQDTLNKEKSPEQVTAESPIPQWTVSALDFRPEVRFL